MHSKLRVATFILTVIFSFGGLPYSLAKNSPLSASSDVSLWILHTNDSFRHATLSSFDVQTGTLHDQIIFPAEKPILPFVRWSPNGEYVAVLIGELTEYRTLTSDEICVFYADGGELFCRRLPIAAQPMSPVGGFEPIAPHWSPDGDVIYVVSDQLTILELDSRTGKTILQHTTRFSEDNLSKWLWMMQSAVLQIWEVPRTSTSLHYLDLADDQTNEIMTDVYAASEIVNEAFIIGSREPIALAHLNGSLEPIDLPTLPESREWFIGRAALSNNGQWLAFENQWLNLIDEQDIRVALILVNAQDWQLVEMAGQSIDNIAFSPDNAYLSARMCRTFFDDSCEVTIFSITDNAHIEITIDGAESLVIRQIFWR